MVFPPCAMVGMTHIDQGLCNGFIRKNRFDHRRQSRDWRSKRCGICGSGRQSCVNRTVKGEIDRIAAPFGDQALAIAGDIADPAFVTALIDETVAHFGGLDVVINNAAALHPIARVEDADIDAWSKLIDINVKGVFYAAKAALPHLMKSGEGIILTVSSGAAHNPLEGWSAYCASKARPP